MIVWLTLFVALQEDPAPPADWKVFEIEEAGIRFSYPPSGVDVVEQKAKPKDKKRSWSVSRKVPSKKDPTQFVSVYTGRLDLMPVAGGPGAEADRFQENFVKYANAVKTERLEDRAWEEAGREWIRRMIRCESRTRGKSSQILMACSVRSSDGVFFYLECSPDTWDQHAQEIAGIISSLKIRYVRFCPACRGDVKDDAGQCAKCGLSLSSKNAALNEFCAKLKIHVVTDPARVYPFKLQTGEIVTGKKASDEEIEAFSALLAREWSRYPAGFFERLNLDKIVLCTDLASMGAKKGGLAQSASGTIHFNVTSPERTIHHELFHFVDFRDDGSTRDSAWSELNAPDFKYGRQSYSEERGFEHKKDGFVSEYARSAVQEDKAEVFASMMSNRKKLAEILPEDKILARKVERMKALLQAFCPKIDDEFWSK